MLRETGMKGCYGITCFARFPVTHPTRFLNRTRLTWITQFQPANVWTKTFQIDKRGGEDQFSDLLSLFNWPMWIFSLWFLETPSIPQPTSVCSWHQYSSFSCGCKYYKRNIRKSIPKELETDFCLSAPKDFKFWKFAEPVQTCENKLPYASSIIKTEFLCTEIWIFRCFQQSVYYVTVDQDYGKSEDEMAKKVGCVSRVDRWSCYLRTFTSSIYYPSFFLLVMGPSSNAHLYCFSHPQFLCGLRNCLWVSDRGSQNQYNLAVFRRS